VPRHEALHVTRRAASHRADPLGLGLGLGDPRELTHRRPSERAGRQPSRNQGKLLQRLRHPEPLPDLTARHLEEPLDVLAIARVPEHDVNADPLTGEQPPPELEVHPRPRLGHRREPLVHHLAVRHVEEIHNVLISTYELM
jgi:hypothetical protein